MDSGSHTTPCSQLYMQTQAWSLLYSNVCALGMITNTWYSMFIHHSEWPHCFLYGIACRFVPIPIQDLCHTSNIVRSLRSFPQCEWMKLPQHWALLTHTKIISLKAWVCTPLPLEQADSTPGDMSHHWNGLRDIFAACLPLVGLLWCNIPTAYQQKGEFSSYSCLSVGTARIRRIQSLQRDPFIAFMFLSACTANIEKICLITRGSMYQSPDSKQNT